MYAIIHNQKVILGIVPWNSKYFTDVLQIRHKIAAELPKNEPKVDAFPFVINEHTSIVLAEENRPRDINPMTEQYVGPQWIFTQDKVTAVYEIKSLSLDDVKRNYIDKAAQRRYDKENAGTITTINGKQHNIETTREGRSKYVEKMSMVNDNTTIVWKFGEMWEQLSKSDLNSIVDAIENHVQGAFDEEYQLVKKIKLAQSVKDLEDIKELNEPPLNEMDE